MDFLRKHWEKILLSVVLLASALAVVWQLHHNEQERLFIEEQRQKIMANPKPYQPLNLAREQAALALQNQYTPIVLHKQHNTFNPVLWQAKADNSVWIKVKTGKEVGPDALVVTAIRPLCTVVSLERVSGQGSSYSYLIGYTREAETNKTLAQKITFYVSPSSKKSRFFSLVEVKGDISNPDELILELDDTKETASVSKDKPFKRVETYVADMKYDIESLTFTGVRKGETISFGGMDYIVVDIDAGQVVLLEKVSGKRIAIKYKAG
jgi:cell division protein FtsL